jgi:hypothetical protein
MTTTHRPRFLLHPFLLLTAIALVLAVSVSGIASANSVKPSVGDYEAHPLEVTGIYKLGAFAVTNNGGKRRIVSSELLPGIFYPNLGTCDSLDLPLSTESIPISKAGKFSVRDHTAVKNDSLLVVWKGHWTKPKKVTGSLTIKYKGCSSKFKWAASRSTPVG